MKKSLIKALIILPGTVGIFIPAFILYISVFFFSKQYLFSHSFWVIVIGIILISVGLILAIVTARLFLSFGHGTPAPWDPPQKLVIKGPYRYVRNPMILGMLIILGGEAFLFASFMIFIWCLVFLLANMVYFPLFEEPALSKRFGGDYIEYKNNVPRWLPRLTAWSKK